VTAADPALPGPAGPAPVPAPARRPRWVRAALGWPATWLFLILSAVGVVVLAEAFGPAVVANPVASITAVVVFTLHGAIFFAIIRTVDWLEPEPRPLIFAALLWGGIIACSNALRANTALESILVKIAPLPFVRDWAAAIEGPTDEEILKTLGIVAIVLLARRQINSILDGVVYGAFVGLGFQEVENVTYSLNAVAQTGTDSVGPVFQMLFVRGLLAGLWSHTVYSAIAGAGVAYAVLRREKAWPVRIGVALLALLVAWSAHFLWNSPAVSAISDLPGGWGTIAALLLKGVVILTAFLVLLNLARRGEFRTLANGLASLRDPAIATPNEIGVLRRRRTRAVARWNAWVYAGRPASRAVKHLQRAQADLAVALRDDGAAVPARLPAVRVARQSLQQRNIADADGFRRSTVLGWVSLVAAFGTLIHPIVTLVPLGFLLLGVTNARRRRQRADPRLRTAVYLALTLSVVWLISFLARSTGLS
jgi:RsiW-degrading membrane proteinase PrsW (M82 family)